uniref:Uncharacterized protein n=1 Tax=Caenorhabditis japonica TaxID=281687 RepID=A0A8R1E0C3_CAEJA
MVLPRRKSIISQEERIARLKESRLKYSQIGKPKNPPTSNQPRTSLAVPTVSQIATKSVPSRPIAPPRTRAQLSSIGPNVSKNVPSSSKASSSANNDNDFEVDPRSLEMIKSGRITIPVNRPSFAASRHTIGSRQSLVGRQNNRFRTSIAQEPRTSLLPFGINVFEANATQKSEVLEFLNSRMSATTTPAKANASGSVFGSVLNSTRHRKIRFMDSAIQEVRESAESAEVAAASTSVHHSPTADTAFMPNSILSTKKNNKKKVNLDAPAPATPRKINFDDEDGPEKENIEKEIENLEKSANVLLLSEVKLSEDSTKRVREIIGKLQKALNASEQEKKEVEKVVKSPSDRIPMTPLGSIMESLTVNEEEEEGQEEDAEEMAFQERKKSRRRSSRMKVGRRASRSRSTVRQE